MVRIQSYPLLSQIRGARSYPEQAAALRALKDEVVGHVQQKETWVERGVLELIVKILQNARSPAKSNGKEARGHVGHTGLTDEEVVRLQALQVLASFAKGGASFVVPIRAAGAVPDILSNIFPLDNPPQIVLAALRALGGIADATRISPQASDDASALAEMLFAPRHLSALLEILTSDATSSVSQLQKNIVCGLISQLCREPQHQNALANAGILDALATRLASFVVRRGEVVPGAELQDNGLAGMLPDPAPQGASFEDTLEAISAIIEDSRFRTCMLLCSPALMAVFPDDIEFIPTATEAKSVWHTLEGAGLSNIRAKPTGAVDYLLPAVPVNQPRSLMSQHSHFPPLSSSLARDPLLRGKTTAWEPNSSDPGSPNGDVEVVDMESPLIPWLLHLVRSTIGLTRVLAASVLASLVKVGTASPERETTIALLVIPVLCQLMKEHDKEKDGILDDSTFIKPHVATNWAVLEWAPAILARFVADSEYLQQAAHDCGAIKSVCKLLKDSYEPVHQQASPRPWSPTPDRGSGCSEGLAAAQTVPHSRLPLYTHRIRTRESCLKLIAAMCSFKEELRKAIVEQGAVAYVVESLNPFPGNPKLGKERAKTDDAQGEESSSRAGNSHHCDNTNAVIIAACHVIRTLGRSIGILRTCLEDYKVAMPLLKLLKHPDPAVQVAACGAICNLVSEVSPMRGFLVEAGIVDVLCDHAHSLNPGLRLNSMWALKHLVHAVDNDLKKKCLDKLEPGWLVRLIVSDTEDDALHARLSLRHDDMTEDDDNEMDADACEDENNPWVWPTIQFAGARSPSHRDLPPRMQEAKKKLTALRDAELNPVRKARNDDLAIQEQGLNFIRNLLGPGTPGSGPEASSEMTEMVDFVFRELHHDHLFDILAQKLRVKVLHPFARRSSSGRNGDTRVLYPQAKIIEAVVCILVHIAASVPRHRQLVIAQTELLRQLGTHFSNKDVDVRRALCHLLTNLVWQDDGQDASACAKRTADLKRLGFLSKLENLELADDELDIRERARAAVWQMKAGTS